MKEKADFAMGDESKDYCVHCANEDGSMHSFEEQKASMTGFIIKTQGLACEAAAAAAAPGAAPAAGAAAPGAAPAAGDKKAAPADKGDKK
jgi:hypothetical protein